MPKKISLEDCCDRGFATLGSGLPLCHAAIILMLSLATGTGCSSTPEAEVNRRGNRNASYGGTAVMNESASGGGRVIGSEAALHIQGRENVFVATDEKALYSLINALSSSDADVESLVQSGQVLPVPNNTKVRIVETDFTRMKVRILEGDHIMKDVWVPERWVQ